MKRRFSAAARGAFIQLSKILGKTSHGVTKARELEKISRGDAEAQGIKRRRTRKALYYLSGIAILFITVWLTLRFSPYPELQAFINRPNSIRYLDRNGRILQITPLTDGLRREIPEYIPAQVKDVFIFAEDKRFYSHFGIDGFAILRAIGQNISGGRRVSGASTITMQLARLISADSSIDNQAAPTEQQVASIEHQSASMKRLSSRTSNRPLLRKTAETINAFRLEARLSKNEILELYLNSLPFGFNTEGIASASRTFFASDISMLSPAQIFCLAVIPRRPGFYNPLDNPDACVAAASELQAKFSKNKKLASSWPLLAETHDDDWKFAASSARRYSYPFELPHLIRHIAANSGGAQDREQGLMREVQLSIDLGLQRLLENAIGGNVMRYYSSRITNGAALVIDNENGEILAWVGSADYGSTEAAGQIDGVLALNQPGSSMKPFLYAMALEKGFKPTDVIADVPMSFGETEVYLPRNFNNRFNGPMLFRTALASSLNIPAVYLLYRLGVQNYAEHLYSMGFNSLKNSAADAGLGLALGNAPVSLHELVTAFSVFPRDGVYIPLTWAQSPSATAPSGPAHTGRIYSARIYSEDTARIICSFLSDPDARVLAFGSGRNFRTSFPAAFKTGTANQFQSIVALGASPNYTVGVWMGNFTGETVIGRTGSSIPAAIVRDTLTFLHGSSFASGSRTDTEFRSPEGWRPEAICAISGMMPGEACLSVISEYIQVKNISHENNSREHKQGNDWSTVCTWHRLVNGRSEVTYPAEYQNWFNTAARLGSLDYSSRPLEILNPRDGFIYLSSPGIGRSEIPVEVIGGSEDTLQIVHNNRFFNVERPFVFFLDRMPGFNTLSVQNGNEEETITFMVER